MQIHRGSRGDLLDLSVEGMLDNESSQHFRQAIDDAIRAGWHRILVDLGGVTYVSSAGIGALLDARKRVNDLHGLFGIWNLKPKVEQVLRQTKVLDHLVRDPKSVEIKATPGTMTWQSETRLATDKRANYEIYRLGNKNSLTCRLYGHPESNDGGLFGTANFQRVTFPSGRMGLGVGGLADDAVMLHARCGEFLSAAGASAQSSATGVPDYSVAREDFTPEVHLLYGLSCDGEFAELIRFDSWDAAQPIPFSVLVRQMLVLAEANSAGMVFLAECAGLMGARLKRSPAHPEFSGRQQFSFPAVREWISFSAEQVHHHTLALITGVAHRVSSDGPLGAAEHFLRPLDDTGEITGHFHSAVFPYRPLKKRMLKLQDVVSELFESGTIRDVLHLLRDDRAMAGSGESELISGGCWVAPIREVIAPEEKA